MRRVRISLPVDVNWQEEDEASWQLEEEEKESWLELKLSTELGILIPFETDA